MFFYALFTYFREEGIGDKGFVGLKVVIHAQPDAVCRKFFKARGKDFGFEDFCILPKADFINRLNLLEAGKLIYQRKRQRFNTQIRKAAKTPKNKGISILNGKEKISLQPDHINGDKHDHRNREPQTSMS